MAKVSVIVPVFKVDEFTEAALASVNQQTYKNIETIVIDDGMGTGAAAARNRGLELATGEYIAFCDSDDYLSVDAIEKMVEAIDGVELVCGSFRKFGLFEQVVSHSRITLPRSEVAKYVLGNLNHPRSNQMLSGCWAKLYRRSLIGLFPELTTAEDMAFNFNYLRKCKEVRFIPEVVYHNRKRNGSLSTTYDPLNKGGLFDFRIALKHVKEFLLPHAYEITIDRAVDSAKMYHSMLYFMRICEQTGKTMRETLMELYP